MGNLSRRSVLRRSLGLAAAGTLARPYIAYAAATTAEVWWAQGFVPEEDVGFKKVIADYGKASGNTIDLSIMPFAPMRQKDRRGSPERRRPGYVLRYSRRDHRALRLGRQAGGCQRRHSVTKGRVRRNSTTIRVLLNSADKKRSYYGVPFTMDVLPNHIWKPLVEKAGYKIEDIPKTWDAFYDFFKEVQKKLRAQGVAQRLWHRSQCDDQRGRSE